MYMFDPKFGDMDVELEVGKDLTTSRISYGYQLATFQELTEEDLDYLNEKYREEILAQAYQVMQEDSKDSAKLYN